MSSFYTRQNQQIVRDYRKAGGPWPAKKIEIAEWALANERWAPTREDIRRMCAEALGDAMREDSFTDEQGRSVRTMMPAKTTRDGEQGTFWDDVRTAPIAFLRVGVSQRRKVIAGECHNLHSIVRYSNEHRGPEEQIQISLNFEQDMIEFDQPVSRSRTIPVSSSPSATVLPLRRGQPRRAPRPSTSRPARRRPSSRPSAPA